MKAQGKSLQLLTRGKHKYISSKSNHINKCKSFILFYSKNLFFLFYTLIFSKQRHQSIYSIHLFNKIFIHLQFYIISSLTTPLSLSLSLTYPKLPKKYYNILCTNYSNHAYIHNYYSTCAFMYNFTLTDMGVFFFFLYQNVHISTLFLFCTIFHLLMQVH